jgi:peptide/nickel transport system substrate-binding protein
MKRKQGLRVVGALAISAMVVAISADAAPDTSTAAQPNVVRLSAGGRFADINPTTMTFQNAWTLTEFVYAPLLTLSARGTAKPNLASGWRVSRNGKRLAFTLRPGLKFSDGRPLRVKDVVATFRRLLSAKNFVYAPNVEPIRSVKAVGKSKVEMTLTRPYPALPALLAQPQFGVFPSSVTAANEKDYFTKRPISAGPYKFASSVSPDAARVVLVRNDNYWGPKPTIPRLEYYVVPDPAARLAQLRSGQLDFADGLSPSSIPQLSGRAKATVVPVFGNYFIAPNVRKPPLNDRRVRQAISLSLDRGRMNQVVFAGKGRIARGFFAPTSQWYQATVPSGPNVAAAKRLLAGTACENGCSLTFTLLSGIEWVLQVATVAQQNLKAIGIDAKIEQLDSSVAYSRLFAGDFEITVSGIFDYTDFPDVTAGLALLSDSPLKALYSGYQSAAMDGAVKLALSRSGKAQRAAIARVNALFGQDLPLIPVLQFAYVSGSRVSPSVFRQAPTSLYQAGAQGGRFVP